LFGSAGVDIMKPAAEHKYPQTNEGSAMGAGRELPQWIPTRHAAG